MLDLPIPTLVSTVNALTAKAGIHKRYSYYVPC